MLHVRNDEAVCQRVQRMLSNHSLQNRLNCITAAVSGPQQQNARMTPGWKMTHVSKVTVERDKETPLRNRSLPNY
jgi:hypothetical protein